MVDRSFYDSPVLGFWLRVNGAIPIRTGQPDALALRQAHAVLKAGEALIVFPRARSPGRDAGARAARHHQPRGGDGAPILPVAVRGAFEAFPRWRRVPRPCAVTVVFGRPLPPPPSTGIAAPVRGRADGS
jgi:1-acyl-sn-glycerol-3-phosphate acyltransferase